MIPQRLWGVAAALVVGLAAAPAVARAGPTRTFDDLPRVLKAGDLVQLTDASGAQLRGRVAELTSCSIVIALSSSSKARLMRDDVKKIRRVSPARARQIAAAARTCEVQDCPPVTHVVAGAAAVAHGFAALFNRPKTIYQAPKRAVVQERTDDCGR